MSTTTMKTATKKQCLVIGPFGKQGSDTRKRSDFLLANVIHPIAQEMGYEAKRDIDICPPGNLLSKLMKAVHASDLVIADLTDTNPNVFYELGIRHCTGKPIILLTFDSPQVLPWDIITSSVIEMTLDPLQSNYEGAKDTLKSQIVQIEAGLADFHTHANDAAQKFWQDKFDKDPENRQITTYEWIIHYSRTLAQDWLSAQPDRTKRLIAESHNRPRRSQQAHLDTVAEYRAYQAASGVISRGILISERKGDAFTGWAIFPVVGSYETIDVHGDSQQDGRIQMNFAQPARTFEFALGVEGNIRAFNYSIEFTPDANDPSALVYRGVLQHPDHPKIEVGKTRLVRR